MADEENLTPEELAARSRAYDPKDVEATYYNYWLSGGYFQAPIREGEQPFTIVIPPPNVTGALHMGHALDNTVQDILIRYHRMKGVPTLWLPGTDHAGLATQIKVEEVLRKEEGLTRHDLGREKFVERVWQWKARYGDTIKHQLEKLGASCDWSRERFTMDEGCSQAVRTVFVQLHKKGLVYKGTRITNWCPQDQTALSDIEIEHEDERGNLWYFRYPLADDSGFVQVATTRPETMLGDTAIAVAPGDERYAALIGKQVRHPATGQLIPIIADEMVDPAFGTGAVKVTPFHDPNDYEFGQRHGVEAIQVIGLKGEITAAGGKYAGLDRFDCRKRLVADLAEQGFLVKVEEHTHSPGRCQRCDTVVEPLISTQWFVKMKPLAEPAMQAVIDGRIRIVPERFVKVYLQWLENIQDWCISRQIFWGHRIPVWYCQECGHQTVALSDPTACEKCGSAKIEQDPDCLDTWFSSALWPFSTLGWPEQTSDLAYFYPTSVLVTGYDILFFWVARMIFSGLEFTGQAPFHTVLLHGLVRDSEGRKMSKSLGNGIDPLEVIDQYGADALRFMLINGTTPGNDMRFYWEKVEEARNFANKLWNVRRFVLSNIQDMNPQGSRSDLQLEDEWILSRLNQVTAEVTGLLEEYQLGEAARRLYDFTWDEFCDWYLEMIKPRLYRRGENAASRNTAQMVVVYVFENVLRLLHPFMPFISEAIWQYLPHVGKSITVAPWPQSREDSNFPESVARVRLVMEAVRAVRSMRAEMNVPPGKPVQLVIHCHNKETFDGLWSGQDHIYDLARAEDVTILMAQEKKPEQAATAVISGADVYLPLAGLIDIEKEMARLRKDLANVAADLEKTRTKLANPHFLEKARPDAVSKERDKAVELTRRSETLEQRLQMLGGQ